MNRSRGYGQCPKCNHENFKDITRPDGEPCLTKITNRHHTNTDYGHGEDWTEHWKCEECGNEFTEKNGYP